MAACMQLSADQMIATAAVDNVLTTKADYVVCEHEAVVARGVAVTPVGLEVVQVD